MFISFVGYPDPEPSLNPKMEFFLWKVGGGGFPTPPPPSLKNLRETLYLEFEAHILQRFTSDEFQSTEHHFPSKTDFGTPSEPISEPYAKFPENSLPKS